MKKTSLIHVIILFFLVSVNSCTCFCKKGQGYITTKIIQVTEFDEIDIDGQAMVFLEQGTVPSVKIMIDSNLHEYVKAEVSGMKLKIHESRCLENLTDYKIYITTNKLAELNVNGSVKVIADSSLRTEKLSLNIKSSGEIRLNIDADEFEIVAGGSGLLKLVGRALDMNIDLDGAGSIDAFGLLAKNVDAQVDGAGSCKIDVSEKFYGNVGGSGKIFYKGNPKKVNTNVTGSGAIQAK